jgi:hypothetical protein
VKCEEVRLSLGGFVLGGLESTEAAEVRRHLALCPGCQNELKAFERVTQALEAAPPPIDPPSHLKDEILSRMRAEKLSSSDQETSSPSEELPSHAELRFRNLRLVLSGVAAVGLVAAVVAIVALGGFGLQTSSSVATIQLIPTEEEENYWGVAELHPQPSGNQQVELELNNLDEPRPDSFYEMWFVSGEKSISAGTFTVIPEGRTEVLLSAPPQAQDYHTVLITEESATDARDSGKEVKLRGEVP